MQPQCECKDKLEVAYAAGLQADRSDVCLAARQEAGISYWILRKIEKLYLNIGPHMIFMDFGSSLINVASYSLRSMKNKPQFSLMEGHFSS